MPLTREIVCLDGKITSLSISSSTPFFSKNGKYIFLKYSRRKILESQIMTQQRLISGVTKTLYYNLLSRRMKTHRGKLKQNIFRFSTSYQKVSLSLPFMMKLLDCGWVRKTIVW